MRRRRKQRWSERRIFSLQGQPQWWWAGARACYRCIRGGGLQARANLNGGELDEVPILPEREHPAVSWMSNKGAEDSAPPPDRPKWRRAGSRAGQTSKEAKGGGWKSSQDQPKWWRAGSINFFGPYLCLLPLPLWPPSSLPLFLAFFPPLGAKSLPFWGATVKKEYLGPGWNHPLRSLWLGLCPCPW